MPLLRIYDQASGGLSFLWEANIFAALALVLSGWLTKRRGFPAARVARLDSDVMQKRGNINAFMRRCAGKDRYSCWYANGGQGAGSLICIWLLLSLPILCNLPDWRAGERTFQLISQLIGRAGRRNKQGLAVVQTYMPEAFPIVTAAERDYQRFYQAELLYRQMHGYHHAIISAPVIHCPGSGCLGRGLSKLLLLFTTAAS